MKKIFFVLSVLFISIVSQAQFTSASLTAAGLTCAMCTKAIYNSLEKLPVVSKVEADIKNSAFLITFKEGASVDPDALKKAVEDAGFSVSRLKLTGDFQNMQVSNDTHINLDGKIYHFLKVSDRALNGTQTLTIVDKNYVSPKEFKKFAASTDYSCIETGKAEKCCTNFGAVHNSRIYHVTL